MNRQLTGLFSLKDKIPACTENSDNKSQICKISEAQSEYPEKPQKGIGESKEIEPKILKETAEHQTPPKKCFTNDSEEKTECSSDELPIH